MNRAAPIWSDRPEWPALLLALQQGRLAEAVAALRMLIVEFPADPILLSNFAVLATDLGELDEARNAYLQVAAITPQFRPRALSGLLRVAQLSGDFAAIDAAEAAITQWLDSGIDELGDVAILKYLLYRRVFVPTLDRFAPALGRRLAELLPSGPRPQKIARPDRRLTIGYLSSGFGDHPIGHVTQALYAAHDRTRFRVLGFSGRDRSAEPAPFAATIRGGFDTLTEIGALTLDRAEAAIRSAGVDILVALDHHMDWNGIFSTPELLARHVAPVQIAWLGVAAGTELPFVDYLFADAVTVPAGEESRFRERIWRLPGCYHCAGPQPIATVAPSRAECGLPPGVTVYAGFNNLEKLSRRGFGAWMKILRAVPGSVLWLTNQRGLTITEANLRREAAALGVEGERLVFAGRLPEKSRHLARHRHADLLLDTLTVNASTTALDALWSGLPVLTVTGSRFAGRIAESFLRHTGLDELVAPDLDAFVARAIAFGLDPAARLALKAKVAHQVATGPLFDTAEFARKLEAAYEAIWREAPPVA